jgi:hypothetical protein
MKKDQVVVNQATKNPSSLSNQPFINNKKLAETKEDNQLSRRSEEKGARTETVDQRNNTPSTSKKSST